MGVTAWAMATHIVALCLWSAALLILAGLYAEPPARSERADVYRHALMCRYVFVVLGSPAAVLAIVSGCVLVALRGADGSWLLLKLAVVAVLALYHAYCGALLHKQSATSPARPSLWRAPLMIGILVVLISTIFVLVLAKPDVVLEYQLAPQPAGHRNYEGAEQRQIQAPMVDGLQWVLQTG